MKPVQLPLLDRVPSALVPPAPVPPAPETQTDHLERVTERIGSEIQAFCEDRLRAGTPEFYMVDLQKHIASRFENVAPDSPSRSLRSLRQRGLVAHELLSRRNSHYRVLPPGTAAHED